MKNIKSINVDKSKLYIDVVFNKSSVWLNYAIVDGYIKFPHLDLERYFGLKPVKAFISNKYCNLSVVFKEMFKSEAAFNTYKEFITEVLSKFENSECKCDVSDYIIDDFTKYMKIDKIYDNKAVIILGDLMYSFTIDIIRNKFALLTEEVQHYLSELNKETYGVSKQLIMTNVRVMDFKNAKDGVFETKFLQRFDELLFNYFRHTLVANHIILKDVLFLPYEKKIKVGRRVINYDFDSEKLLITYSFHNLLSIFSDYKPPQDDSMIDYIESDLLRGTDKLLYTFVINMLWKKQLTEEHIKIESKKEPVKNKFRISECENGLAIFYQNDSQVALSYDIIGKSGNNPIVNYYKKDLIVELTNYGELDYSAETWIHTAEDLQKTLDDNEVFEFINTQLSPHLIKLYKDKKQKEEDAIPIFEITSVIETPISENGTTKYVLVEYKSKLTGKSRTIIKYQKDGYNWIPIIRPYILLSLIEREGITVNVDMLAEAKINDVFTAINQTYGDKYKSSYNLFMMFFTEVNKKLVPNYFTEITPVVKDVVINMTIGSKSFSIIYDYSKKTYYVEIESRLLDAGKLEDFNKFSESDIRLITSIIKSLKIDSI